MNWFVTTNRDTAVPRNAIPILPYAQFYDEMCTLLLREECHCAAYFGMLKDEGVNVIALVLNDTTGEVFLASHDYAYYRDDVLPSLTARFPAMHLFEREITENFGLLFENNPWLKPLRFSHNRAQGELNHNNYPFYAMQGADLHEVNVGPIHAGIIEPGVFRFICNGEQVLHLEIVLGYQHRGVESLMSATSNRLRQCMLSESVAGDSVVAHTTAYCRTVESLAGCEEVQARERVIALELERVALHLADTAALCTDIAYQLGKVACEALRTVVINTTQLWCGNRFAKGLIRPCGTNYPLTESLRTTLFNNLAEVEHRYAEVVDNLLVTPTVLARFEECGVVTLAQAQRIGAVGMAARASGAVRDLRSTHPWGAYTELNHTPVVLSEGDVQARLNVRMQEVPQSIAHIRALLACVEVGTAAKHGAPDYDLNLMPNTLAFALVEGWRGEICHVALTDSMGVLTHYKIKDPSMHNWMALALSVRGGAISDFPICNKSFNLSYCGHDL